MNLSHEPSPIMNETVSNFHLKNADQNYCDTYVRDHLPRVKWVVEHFALDKIENQRVLEIGCGRGLYFSQMSQSNYLVGMDGAIIPPDKKLCNFLNLRVDLDHDDFGMLFDNEEKFDVLICSETLEHLSNIDRVMIQMKKLLKDNGMAIFTVPHISLGHPVAFPGLFYPEQNFKIFIEQYAWIVEDYALFDGNWKACCFKVRNAPMIEQRMIFPKSEAKFHGKTPIEQTNL